MMIGVWNIIMGIKMLMKMRMKKKKKDKKKDEILKWMKIILKLMMDQLKDGMVI